MDYTYWCIRAVLFACGYFLAVAIISIIPVITIYPSENNLHHMYHDDNGTCYRYERKDVNCDDYT